MQRFNIIFNPLYELRLVLAYGAAYVRTHEQSVETWEYAEHFIGVLRCAQLVSEVGGDACFDAVWWFKKFF